jgi:anthranilate synthase component I
MKLKKLNVITRSKKLLADMVTPVSIYLKLRDRFGSPLLLESTDFHARENSRSFICVEPLASVTVRQRLLSVEGFDEQTLKVKLEKQDDFLTYFKQFTEAIDCVCPDEFKKFNGLFGHTNFEAVEHFESIRFEESKRKLEVPEIFYAFYRFIIVIDHFKDELYMLENCPQGEASRLSEVEELIGMNQMPVYPFQLQGKEESNLSDEEFKALVSKGKEHCQSGDVFQIVFSRQFSRAYQGDAFNVYRALRSLNPSPYLFYFDYGNYTIFGSSPEAQLIIEEQKAQIHPIAGTFRRTGNDQIDAQEAQRLAEDPKENAEHVMLVDLARNDLSRNTSKVQVKEFKTIQYFSHVIHLVSKVEGALREGADAVQIFADTFPAGTLSGAPKYKAMQLISKYENQQRGFYGGAIGQIGLNGDLNQAIIIRSFLAQNNKLYYQAGAGVVIDSQEESELQEVNNKLGALKSALKLAETLN